MLTMACARLMAVSTSPRAWPKGLPICVLMDKAIASLFLENSVIHLQTNHSSSRKVAQAAAAESRQREE